MEAIVAILFVGMYLMMVIAAILLLWLHLSSSRNQNHNDDLETMEEGEDDSPIIDESGVSITEIDRYESANHETDENENNLGEVDEDDDGASKQVGIVHRWWRRWKLRRQAALDYDNARGTSHLRMIEVAQKNIHKRIRSQERELRNFKNRKSKLEEKRKAEYLAQLRVYLVNQRLDEVQGIGPRLKRRILQQVFRGSLQDLHLAHRVVGVGESKQHAISMWVHRYQQEMPTLLRTDFPGKEAIRIKYRDHIQRLEEQIRQIRRKRHELVDLLSLVRHKTSGFPQLRKKDFVRALIDDEIYPEDIERYLQGLFPPWEPMPDWFRQVVDEGRPQ
jgi:hypothetical protein